MLKDPSQLCLISGNEFELVEDGDRELIIEEDYAFNNIEESFHMISSITVI